MQDANGRQYKREMASFEVGSENASTMAGSVLRDERALERGGRNGDERDGRDRERRTDEGVRMVGATQKGGKEAVPVTYEMEMTVPCVARHLLLFPTNLILSREYQVIRASASSLRRNVIGYMINY